MGDRCGQHSIRVNDRYRICIVWHDGDADNVEVEIVDYHQRKGGKMTKAH